MRRPTVLIADDHTIVAEGLVKLLSERFDVVATVADGAALVEAAERLRPDIIITDLNMPSVGGLEAMARLKKRGATSKFVILTMHREASVAAKAMRAGASAFLLKASAGEELIDAIDEVLNGRTYLSPAVTKGVLAAFDQAGGDGSRAHATPAGCAASHRRGPSDEGNRRHSRPLGSHRRNSQVRNDACAGRAVDG